MTGILEKTMKEKIKINEYIRRIRNPEKKRYAVDYSHGKTDGKDYNASYMALQAVRMEIDSISGGSTE